MTINGFNVPTFSKDVVGVYSSDGTSQLFEKARPLKASVTTAATVMTHPVEDGSTVTDYKVVNPTEIELSMVLSSDDYPDVYKSIKEAFVKSTLLTVQTRSGSYSNMMIAAMPHDEDAAMYDSLSLALKLKEVKFATVKTAKVPVSSPKDARDTKTSPGGKKQPKAKESSVLFQVFQ